MTTIKKGRLVFDFRNFSADSEGTIRCEYRVKTIEGRNVKVNAENDGFFFGARVDPDNNKIGFYFRFAIKDFYGIELTEETRNMIFEA